MSTIENASLRQEHVTTLNSRFYDDHRPELTELFSILGVKEQAGETLAGMVKVTQPWVKGDHFTPENREQINAQTAEKARGLYTKMGLVESTPIPSGQYDQVIVLGGMQRANELRLGFLEQALRSGGINVADDGQILLWGGQRPINNELEKPYVDQAQTDIAKGDHQAQDNPWLKAFWGGQFEVSETELIRLAALHNLGELSLKRLHLRLGSAAVPISHYEFSSGITLLNTPAVVRPHGESRHTTEACAQDWLEIKPPKLNAKVAFVTGNPYTRRTARVVKSVLDKNGRQDVRLVAGGPGAYPDTDKDYLFLGEIARNLYEDLKQAS
jgi:hypothetical protein